MKRKSNLNATEGDYKNETFSLHNIYGKQKKMSLKDLVEKKNKKKKTKELFFLILNSQSNISQFNRDIFKTLGVQQQNTQTEAENHYSSSIWNAGGVQTWLADKNSNTERYSKVLTLGVIQMRLTWLYHKPALPPFECAGVGGIYTAITQQ